MKSGHWPPVQFDHGAANCKIVIASNRYGGTAMKSPALVTLAFVLMTAPAYAQAVPNMPTKNPWLADSAFPISHSNSAATEAVAHAGPTKGRKLSVADVKTVPNVFTSNPTVKNVSGERIIIASGVDGIRVRPSNSSRSCHIPVSKTWRATRGDTSSRVERSRRRSCPLMAFSGHSAHRAVCLLLGVERTSQ